MLSLALQAQGIRVEGPTAVYNGEQFQIRYVVNTTDVKGFRMGNTPDAFEVLMGPSTSTQQRLQKAMTQPSRRNIEKNW